MILDSCGFETARLIVADRARLEADYRLDTDIRTTVASVLTDRVTRSLPPDWRGPYDGDRATAWIADRESEGPLLLVVDRSSHRPIGFMVLVESDREDAGGVDVRLGYLLAETAWGRGFAGELVQGFVAWCRARPLIRSLAGGVERDNAASIRVLERIGFAASHDPQQRAGEERLFVLDLTGDASKPSRDRHR